MTDIDWSKAPSWSTSYATKKGKPCWKYWLDDKGYQFGDDGCFYEFGASDNSTEYYVKGDFIILEDRPTFELFEDNPNWVEVEPLTKREQFAMAAMQGYTATEITLDCDDIAKMSVYMADTLLKELAK